MASFDMPANPVNMHQPGQTTAEATDPMVAFGPSDIDLGSLFDDMLVEGDLFGDMVAPASTTCCNSEASYDPALLDGASAPQAGITGHEAMEAPSASQISPYSSNSNEAIPSEQANADVATAPADPTNQTVAFDMDGLFVDDFTMGLAMDGVSMFDDQLDFEGLLAAPIDPLACHSNFAAPLDSSTADSSPYHSSSSTSQAPTQQTTPEADLSNHIPAATTQPAVSETQPLEVVETEPTHQRVTGRRDNPCYLTPPSPVDGLYHCPFAASRGCTRRPERLKCNFDKHLDSHVKPWSCGYPGCNRINMSSPACVLRHYRENHEPDSVRFFCPYRNCERGYDGKGFRREWNLEDHMERIHHHVFLPGEKKGKPKNKKKPRTKRSSSEPKTNRQRNQSPRAPRGRRVQDPPAALSIVPAPSAH